MQRSAFGVQGLRGLENIWVHHHYLQGRILGFSMQGAGVEGFGAEGSGLWASG